VACRHRRRYAPLAPALVEGGSVDKVTVGLFKRNDCHFVFWKLSTIAMGVSRVERDPLAFPGVPRLDPERVRPLPVAEDYAAPDTLASEDGQEALCKLTASAVTIFEKIIH
jgi:hypothetical protein